MGYVFSERLLLEICVPILCVTFDFDSHDLDPLTGIEKISDQFQLARNVRHDFESSAHECVISAATHWLVLRGWSIENKDQHATSAVLGEFSSFAPALPKVESFFAALRTAHGIETGYSQFVIRPDGWEQPHNWKAFLPPVHVVSTRAYPDHFENYGWLREPPVIRADQMQTHALVFKALFEAKTNSLAIAARRLNAAYLRKDEADSILDVTIALEALLGDDARAEMTHKLAMRMAALASIEPCAEGDPSEVFHFVKKIYAYRSAIIHGSKKSETKRKIATKKNEEIPTVTLGLKLLRHAITTLARNPDYLDSEKLDHYLIS